ncbi:MAG TPA: hypothetical protein VHY84_10920 [Bryobacteraceae bacterium]|nr:hypothetical protein [Bryobacteraceae bacterium]
MTLGVAAELRYEWKTSVLEGELEQTNDQIVQRLGDDASQLEGRLKTASAKAEKSAQTSEQALTRSIGALEKADEGERRVGRIQAFLTPRSLTQMEMNDLRDAFNLHFSHWIGEPRKMGLKAALWSDFVT